MLFGRANDRRVWRGSRHVASRRAAHPAAFCTVCQAEKEVRCFREIVASLSGGNCVESTSELMFTQDPHFT